MTIRDILWQLSCCVQGYSRSLISSSIQVLRQSSSSSWLVLVEMIRKFTWDRLQSSLHKCFSSPALLDCTHVVQCMFPNCSMKPVGLSRLNEWQRSLLWWWLQIRVWCAERYDVDEYSAHQLVLYVRCGAAQDLLHENFRPHMPIFGFVHGQYWRHDAEAALSRLTKSIFQKVAEWFNLVQLSTITV